MYDTVYGPAVVAEVQDSTRILAPDYSLDPWDESLTSLLQPRVHHAATLKDKFNLTMTVEYIYSATNSNHMIPQTTRTVLLVRMCSDQRHTYATQSLSSAISNKIQLP